MNKRFVVRIRWLTLLFLAMMLIIVGRLYMLQILHGKDYLARANAQFILPQSPLIDRASIYFSDKTGTPIIAATLEEGFSLALNPSKITNPETLYQQVNTIVPVDHAAFISKATKPNTQYVVVANHLPTAQGQALEAKNLPGVIVAEDRWRYYPGGSLAAQELGFVAYNNAGVEQGQYGLEQFYNSTLTRDNQDLYTNFFVQLFSGVQSSLQGTSQTGDIVTTIEPAVQAELEQVLAGYMNQWHPQYLGGIIMDPQTGAIYAMAIDPSFDLNKFNQQTDPSIFNNIMAQNIYEMGSIVKPLTMAAGLDSGAITPTTTYNDTGCITVNKSKICNFDFRARGITPMQLILTQSLNVGASFIATQMGSSTMRTYFVNRYQLASSTGIDLPGEVTGHLHTLYAPEQVDYDTASFGQGIAMTPLETLRALNSLVNGGYLVTPHLVKAINYDTGLNKTLNWGTPTRDLSQQAADTVRQMLVTVVNTAGVDYPIRIPHYSIGAKTGTAQIVDPTTGTYYAHSYMHTYFGFLPGSNPQFSVFLLAYKPVGAPYAADTWSPYFHQLTEFLINYYNVPPDQ